MKGKASRSRVEELKPRKGQKFSDQKKSDVPQGATFLSGGKSADHFSSVENRMVRFFENEQSLFKR
jgi:hypothetical protein